MCPVFQGYACQQSVEIFMNTLMLSRIQFGLTISFHYLFPPLSIGLAMLMVVMEGLYLKTGNKVYEQMARFWTKIFALTFGIGVATGIVMEFEFGTNWANYSRFVGDIFGSPLASEGIFAFFLESGFLAILLFGWDRVSPKMHFFSTAMVSLGSIFSAVWINVANSWMQTPAGFKLLVKSGGAIHAVTFPANTNFGRFHQLVAHGQVIKAEITSFWQVVFNPSTLDRLLHVLLGAEMAGAFLVISISAWYILKNRHMEIATRSLKIGLAAAVIGSVLQLFSGDLNARMIAHYQPAKLAAFEGVYKAHSPASMSIFGWANSKNQTVEGIKMHDMLSWLLYFNSRHAVLGLDHFKRSDWPPVNPVFQTYHLMVGIGMFLIFISLLGILFWWRGTLFQRRWLLWIFVFSVAGPEMANEFGWFSAEVGRQPWIVYGILRTSQGVSPHLPAGEVLASIIMFGLVYLMLGTLFIFLLNGKIQHGPDEHPALEAPPASPLPAHGRMNA